MIAAGDDAYGDQLCTMRYRPGEPTGCVGRWPGGPAECGALIGGRRRLTERHQIIKSCGGRHLSPKAEYWRATACRWNRRRVGLPAGKPAGVACSTPGPMPDRAR